MLRASWVATPATNRSVLPRTKASDVVDPTTVASSVDQLREALFFIAPGFLTLKTFQMFGAERQRSEWEWTVWSVLVSLAIDVVTKSPAAKLIVAALLGVLLVLLYRWTLNRRLRRELVNSAWDHTLDVATRARNPVEITVNGGRYFGRLRTFAKEETRAEPWVYLTDVYEHAGGRWRRLSRTEGVLVHADKLTSVRVIRNPYAPGASAAEVPLGVGGYVARALTQLRQSLERMRGG